MIASGSNRRWRPIRSGRISPDLIKFSTVLFETESVSETPPTERSGRIGAILFASAACCFIEASIRINESFNALISDSNRSTNPHLVLVPTDNTGWSSRESTSSLNVPKCARNVPRNVPKFRQYPGSTLYIGAKSDAGARGLLFFCRNLVPTISSALN